MLKRRFHQNRQARKTYIEQGTKSSKSTGSWYYIGQYIHVYSCIFMYISCIFHVYFSTFSWCVLIYVPNLQTIWLLVWSTQFLLRLYRTVYSRNVKRSGALCHILIITFDNNKSPQINPIKVSNTINTINTH